MEAVLVSQATYVNSNDEFAHLEFSNVLYEILKNLYSKDRQMVILCIGTDRVTGDSFGPMIGYKLEQSDILKEVSIYGTLEKPVHAKNLERTIKKIKETYANPLIIAVDASIGSFKSVGHLTVGEGEVRPGAGVNRNLPAVGDMYITGIVSFGGLFGANSIQNTRLGLVMKMADIASFAIKEAVARVALDGVGWR